MDTLNDLVSQIERRTSRFRFAALRIIHEIHIYVSADDTSRMDADLVLESEGLSPNVIVRLHCRSIHGLNIRDLNHRSDLLGFDITDKKSDQWEPANRFWVSDYEFSAIGFYCADIVLESVTETGGG